MPPDDVFYTKKYNVIDEKVENATHSKPFCFRNRLTQQTLIFFQVRDNHKFAVTMILTDHKFLHEQPSVTSSVPPLATAQGRLTIAGTTNSAKDHSYTDQGGTGIISPTISTKTVVERKPEDSVLTEENPPMPNLASAPRNVSTCEGALIPSSDSSSGTNQRNPHESITSGNRKLFVGGLPTDSTFTLMHSKISSPNTVLCRLTLSASISFVHYV